MTATPCRYCLQDARESICLRCRARFEALERENASLKQQVAFLRRQAASKFRETKASIARSMRPRGK